MGFDSIILEDSVLNPEDLASDSAQFEVDRLCSDWGWSTREPEILRAASVAVRFMNMKSGECLADLGVMSVDRINEILETKPTSQKALEWVARTEPTVRPMIDMILALRAGHAYYESFKSFKKLTLHSAMQDRAVQNQCDSLGCILMVIEESAPVVIFSAYRDLLKYISKGRADKKVDVIRLAVNRGNGERGAADEIHVGLGRRDEVITLLSQSKGNQIDQEAGNDEYVWYGDTPIDKYQRQIARILDHAISNNVTDISIVPVRGGGARNYMRRYGDLVPVPVEQTFSMEESLAVVNFLMSKSGANPNSSRVRTPCDGQITYRSSAGDMFLRLSFIPLCHPGESMDLISTSIRLLPRSEHAISLTDLNMPPDIREAISAHAKFSSGLILVAGPTNTGKSTTLAGIIGEHYKHFGHRRKRISIENPIERFLPGIIQINVSDQAGRGFDSMLRAIKRHDPDVIWVGEIRDRETAGVCVASATSGHLVMSTIHANDTLLAYDTLAKYVDTDVRFQLIQAMSLIISQRLVKRLCSKCSEVSPPTVDEMDLFTTYSRLHKLSKQAPTMVAHANHVGCDQCTNGYSGILPINEVLPVSRDVKDAFVEMLEGRNMYEVIRSNLLVSLHDSAMRLVNQNLTELESALI